MSTLAALIKKNGLRQLATLTVATAATPSDEKQSIVASVATVTVAIPDIEKIILLGPAKNSTIEATNESTALLPALSTEDLNTQDDRRHCAVCSNLLGGRCLAAWRGDIEASKHYRPIDDLPRRCEGYQPKANDPDQRSGRQRWPRLINPRGL